MKDQLINNKTIDAVARRVGLVHDQGMQDWDLEMVTAKDAKRLIDFYGSFEKTEEKAILMRLMIAAYDDYLRDRQLQNRLPDQNVKEKIITFLRQDWNIHRPVVRYWSCFDHGDGGAEAADESECFPVTPMMRKLWKEHGE